MCGQDCSKPAPEFAQRRTKGPSKAAVEPVSAQEPGLSLISQRVLRNGKRRYLLPSPPHPQPLPSLYLIRSTYTTYSLLRGSDRRGYKRAPPPPQLTDIQESAVLLLLQVCCLYLNESLKSTWLGSWLSRVYRIFQIYSIYEPLAIPNPVSFSPLFPAPRLPPTSFFFLLFYLSRKAPSENHHL